MLDMANITTVQNDGGGSILYTAIQASGGENSPAIWRNQAYSGYPGFRPEFRFVARDNGSRTARRVDYQYSMPALFTDSAGKTTVAHRFNASGSFLVPKEAPEATCVEGAYQCTGLLASTLIRFGIFQGLAPA